MEAELAVPRNGSSVLAVSPQVQSAGVPKSTPSRERRESEREEEVDILSVSTDTNEAIEDEDIDLLSCDRAQVLLRQIAFCLLFCAAVFVVIAAGVLLGKTRLVEIRFVGCSGLTLESPITEWLAARQLAATNATNCTPTLYNGVVGIFSSCVSTGDQICRSGEDFNGLVGLDVSWPCTSAHTAIQAFTIMIFYVLFTFGVMLSLCWSRWGCVALRLFVVISAIGVGLNVIGCVAALAAFTAVRQGSGVCSGILGWDELGFTFFGATMFYAVHVVNAVAVGALNSYNTYHYGKALLASHRTQSRAQKHQSIEPSMLPRSSVHGVHVVVSPSPC